MVNSTAEVKHVKKAVFIVNRPDYLLSHRLGLVLELKKSDYQVHVISVPHASSNGLANLGVEFHPLNIERGGANPISELVSILKCYFLVKDLSPDLLHCITIKPVFYGAFITRLIKIPKVIISVAGLGSVFTTNSNKNKVLRFIIVSLLRFGFYKRNVEAIFQNNEDLTFFVSNSVIENQLTHLIRGSGVDLNLYSLAPLPQESLQTVLLPARLIAEKGVMEFVEVAKIILSKRDDVEFWLAGEPDFGNPTSLSHETIDHLKAISGIRFLGHRSDMNMVLKKCSLVVLPSYREGFPKALIEAAAVGRPIVTTDVPGCRDAVIPGVTGLLVPLKSVDDLVFAIEDLLNNREKAQQFGLAARKFAEQNFDVHRVTAMHRVIYGL